MKTADSGLFGPHRLQRIGSRGPTGRQIARSRADHGKRCYDNEIGRWIERSQSKEKTGELGSRWHPFINCVVTQNPYHPFYGAGGVECYWTAPKFMGWYPYANDPGSDGYGGHLEAFGF